jgi:hypothetical protein
MKHLLIEILPYLFLATIVIGGFWTLWHLGGVMHNFSNEANRIEDLIKKNADQSEVVSAIYELKKKSFHRDTGARLRELAKMAEVKYGVQILSS